MTHIYPHNHGAKFRIPRPAIIFHILTSFFLPPSFRLLCNNILHVSLLVLLWKYHRRRHWETESTIKYGFHCYSVTQYQRHSRRTSSSTRERILRRALLSSFSLSVWFPRIVFLRLDQRLCLLDNNSDPLDRLRHLMHGDDLNAPFMLR